MLDERPETPPVDVDQAHRVLTFLCLSLAGSVALMAGVSALLVTTGAFPPFLGYPQAVRLGVGIFLILLLGASYPLYGLAGGSGEASDPAGAVTAFQTRVITSMAVREFVGIAGALLILLSRDFILGGTLAGLSLITIVLALPRKEDLLEAVRKAR